MGTAAVCPSLPGPPAVKWPHTGLTLQLRRRITPPDLGTTLLFSKYSPEFGLQLDEQRLERNIMAAVEDESSEI